MGFPFNNTFTFSCGFWWWIHEVFYFCFCFFVELKTEIKPESPPVLQGMHTHTWNLVELEIIVNGHLQITTFLLQFLGDIKCSNYLAIYKDSRLKLWMLSSVFWLCLIHLRSLCLDLFPFIYVMKEQSSYPLWAKWEGILLYYFETRIYKGIKDVLLYVLGSWVSEKDGTEGKSICVRNRIQFPNINVKTQAWSCMPMTSILWKTETGRCWVLLAIGLAPGLMKDFVSWE